MVNSNGYMIVIEASWYDLIGIIINVLTGQKRFQYVHVGRQESNWIINKNVACKGAMWSNAEYHAYGWFFIKFRSNK